MDAKKTGELIALLRREQDLNQSELTERLGVTNKAISRWETGRGYPDIETLPKISEVLGISIPELLEGKRDQPAEPELDHHVLTDRSIESVCQYAGQQTRRQKKKFRLLTAFLFVFVSIISLISLIIRISPFIMDLYLETESFYISAVDFYWSIVGSEDCIVAADYKSLTYLGKTYVPIPLNGYEGEFTERMVDECQVEGAGFLGKLFFGESLYEVENIPNNELVYLQTDYDDCISRYFVLETEYDRYTSLLNQLEVDTYYACSYNESWYRSEWQLSEALCAQLRIPDGDPVSQLPEKERGVVVRAYDELHTFYYEGGHLYRTADGYYWCPAEFPSHGYGMHPGCTWTERFYPIHGFDEELNVLFSS